MEPITQKDIDERQKELEKTMQDWREYVSAKQKKWLELERQRQIEKSRRRALIQDLVLSAFIIAVGVLIVALVLIGVGAL